MSEYHDALLEEEEEAFDTHKSTDRMDIPTHSISKRLGTVQASANFGIKKLKTTEEDSSLIPSLQGEDGSNELETSEDDDGYFSDIGLEDKEAKLNREVRLKQFAKRRTVEGLRFLKFLLNESSIKHDSKPEDVMRFLISQYKFEFYDPFAPERKQNDSFQEQNLEVTRSGVKAIQKYLGFNIIKAGISGLEYVNRRYCFYAFIYKLCDHTPFVTGCDSFDCAMKKIGNAYRDILNVDAIRRSAVGYFLDKLHILEPWFHPLIRKAHLETILSIFRQHYRGDYFETSRRFLLIVVKSLGPLESCASSLIEKKKESSKMYTELQKKVNMHQDFQKHLSQCASEGILKYDCDIKQLLTDKTVVPPKYGSLDETLIESSLSEILKLLNDLNMIDRYCACMKVLAEEETHEKQKEINDLIDNFRRLDHTDSEIKDIHAYKVILDALKQKAFSYLSEDYVLLGVSHCNKLCNLMTKDPSRVKEFLSGIEWKLRRKGFIMEEAQKKGARFHVDDIYLNYYKPLWGLDWDGEMDL